MTTNLKQEERLDDLQIHGYEIIQHPGRFCFGMDAVLLSNFAAVKKGESALDLGTGTGWRSRKKVRIWRKEVWHTIIWSRR